MTAHSLRPLARGGLTNYRAKKGHRSGGGKGAMNKRRVWWERKKVTVSGPD